MIGIRKAVPDDGKDIGELMLLSAPYFSILFGNNIKKVLQDLFRHPKNLFSLEHIYFAEVGGENAGMILGYDWQVKKRENLKTGFLLFKKIGFGILDKLFLLLRFNSTVGRLSYGEYYISNIATYPKFQRRGVGKRLLLEAEKEAKIVGAERIVLDVEKENNSAINFYQKFGYKMIDEFSISLSRDKILNFNRMIKEMK
uniref:N-acetyltransferase n=1 Tax=candidate division WOR-3 bacterium TaxID=2052148 RepID=A0A7C6ED94_UNCW3